MNVSGLSVCVGGRAARFRVPRVLHRREGLFRKAFRDPYECRLGTRSQLCGDPTSEATTRVDTPRTALPRAET